MLKSANGFRNRSPKIRVEQILGVTRISCGADSSACVRKLNDWIDFLKNGGVPVTTLTS